MRTERHPTLDILVREDGCIYVPKKCNRPAHWTFGSVGVGGYLRVQINGKQYRVHRLVLEAFVGPCPEGFECDHSDRNRRNNALTNLRWLSRTDNNRNRIDNDRVDARGGTHSYEDMRQFAKEKNARRYASKRQEILEQKSSYYAQNRDKKICASNLYRKSKSLTHKRIRFSDGKQRWIPNEHATELLKVSVKERNYVR